MTIKQRKYVQKISRSKKIMIMKAENGLLTEAAGQESFQMPGVGQNLWHDLSGQWGVANLAKRRQCTDQPRPNMNMGYEGIYTRSRRLRDGQMNKENTIDKNLDDLLMLAHSAQLMSELEENDRLRRKQREDQNHEDQNFIGKQLNRMPVIADVKSEKDGIQCGERRIRLTEIKRQARSKGHLFVQERLGEHTAGHVQERTTCLTQIRQQARSKNQLLMKQSFGEQTSGNVHGRRIRLTEVRRLARLKGHLPSHEIIEECSNGNLQGRLAHLNKLQCQAQSKNEFSAQGSARKCIMEHPRCRISEEALFAADGILAHGYLSDKDSVDLRNMVITELVDHDLQQPAILLCICAIKGMVKLRTRHSV